jgi:hypothetical protein
VGYMFIYDSFSFDVKSSTNGILNHLS